MGVDVASISQLLDNLRNLKFTYYLIQTYSTQTNSNFFIKQRAPTVNFKKAPCRALFPFWWRYRTTPVRFCDVTRQDSNSKTKSAIARTSSKEEMGGNHTIKRLKIARILRNREHANLFLTCYFCLLFKYVAVGRSDDGTRNCRQSSRLSDYTGAARWTL